MTSLFLSSGFSCAVIFPVVNPIPVVTIAPEPCAAVLELCVVVTPDAVATATAALLCVACPFSGFPGEWDPSSSSQLAGLFSGAGSLLAANAMEFVLAFILAAAALTVPELDDAAVELWVGG